MMSAKEMCQRLGISYGYFRQRYKDHPEEYPKSIVIGQRRKWEEEAVEKWIRNQYERT